jgi:hypothetical protein
MGGAELKVKDFPKDPVEKLKVKNPGKLVPGIFLYQAFFFNGTSLATIHSTV